VGGHRERQLILLRNSKLIEKRDVPCNLCGSTDHSLLLTARDRLYGCDGTFTYVECKECGLVYMNPQVSPGDIGKLYPSTYTPHKQKSETRQQNLHLLKAKLKKRPFPAVVCDKLTKQSRLLDVGCGNADFLNEVRNVTQCQVYGIDISRAAAEAAKANHGIDMFTGTILQCPFPEGYFDVITSWWYLEHVSNPSEVLRKMAVLLKQDGHCVIGIPNIDSFNARTFGNKWYHLDCPRHLHIYSPDTIAKLLDKAGFDVRSIFFHRAPWGLFHSIRLRFGNDEVPLKNRKRLMCSSMLKRILLPWTILLALLKKADIMVVYARRKETCLDVDRA